MIKRFSILFFGQLIMMGLVTWSYRVIAAGNVPMTAFVETIWACSNFWYAKHVIKDESTAGWMGYSLGCIVGTTASVWLTKVLA